MPPPELVPRVQERHRKLCLVRFGHFWNDTVGILAHLLWIWVMNQRYLRWGGRLMEKHFRKSCKCWEMLRMKGTTFYWNFIKQFLHNYQNISFSLTNFAKIKQTFAYLLTNFPKISKNTSLNFFAAPKMWRNTPFFVVYGDFTPSKNTTVIKSNFSGEAIVDAP